MKNRSLVAGMSLKAKMSLSYLLVIVGTVIILSIAITAAAQSYFYDLQMQDVHQTAIYNAQQLVYRYVRAGYSWDFTSSLEVNNPSGIFDVSDSKGIQQRCLDIASHGFDQSQNCASNIF